MTKSPVTTATPWHRRRWWVAGAALVVAIATTIIVVVNMSAESPEDVVMEYLDVLRSGDSAAAKPFYDPLPDSNDASDDLLVDAAMSADWTVTHLVRRYPDSRTFAAVDVTITAKDSVASEGRFELTFDDDTGWRIQNPLVKLDVSTLPMTYVDFNGVTSKSDTVWLFPGAYHAFAGVSTIMNVPTYVAVPEADNSGGEEATRVDYEPILSLTDGYAEPLGQQLNAWIDNCAKSIDLFPEDCPFSAGGKDEREVNLYSEDYRTDQVTWTVKTYPTIRLEPDETSFRVIVVKPGEVTIAGEGEAQREDGDPMEKFETGCDIELDRLTVKLEANGQFSFRAIAVYSCARSYD